MNDNLTLHLCAACLAQSLCIIRRLSASGKLTTKKRRILDEEIRWVFDDDCFPPVDGKLRFRWVVDILSRYDMLFGMTSDSIRGVVLTITNNKGMTRWQTRTSGSILVDRER